MTNNTNECRHFLGFRITQNDGKMCALGRDVRKWVTLVEGNTHGIAFKLPCTKQGEGISPCFECPDVDRRTQEEVEQRRKEMDAFMDKAIAGLGALHKMKEKMIANKLQRAKATCPYCGEKDTMLCSVAPNNNHFHAKCIKCEMGVME